jgi:hypothetical protein
MFDTLLTTYDMFIGRCGEQLPRKSCLDARWKKRLVERTACGEKVHIVLPGGTFSIYHDFEDIETLPYTLLLTCQFDW